MKELKTVSVECENKLQEKIGRKFSIGIERFQKQVIKKWILRPGMEFEGPMIWWANPDKTRFESYGGGPHEGIDFAIGINCANQLISGMENMEVKTFLPGHVLWTFKDLAGDTVIIEYPFEIDGYQLVCQYSHLKFDVNQLRRDLKCGDTIGYIPVSENPKSLTTSHLHFSMALMNKKYLFFSQAMEFNTWLEWEKCGDLLYIDPLKLVDETLLKNRFIFGSQAKAKIGEIIIYSSTKEKRIQNKRNLSKKFPGTKITTKMDLSDAESYLDQCDSIALIIHIEEDCWRIHRHNNTLRFGQIEGNHLDILISELFRVEIAGISK